jgi:hypothetical protein
LRSVKKSDCSSCGDSDSKSKPVIFCAHYDFTSCPCRASLCVGFLGVPIGWLLEASVVECDQRNTLYLRIYQDISSRSLI